MANADLGIFAAKAWADHRVDLKGAEDARNKASENLFNGTNRMSGTTPTPEEQQAHGDRIEAFKVASEHHIDEKARSGMGNHYNELRANGVPRSVAGTRAAAHGFNNATRGLGNFAKASPAAFAALTVLGGTGLYQAGKHVSNDDENNPYGGSNY